MRWQHKVELLINGTWTEMTGDSAPPRQTVPIRSGRANESSRIQPASCSVQLKNKNGWLTPRNPVSPWYPYIRRGTQLRHSIKAGSPHLTVTGTTASKASTGDDSSLDITSDWFIAVEIEPPLPYGEFVLAGKYSTTSNQRSIALTIRNDPDPFNCYLTLRWSPDGTSAAEIAQSSLFAFLDGLPTPLWGPLTYAAWLDVNDGAGNNYVHYYSARTIEDIEADPTGSEFDSSGLIGTTSVFSSTASLEVGALANGPGGISPYTGKIRRVRVRAGDVTGAVRANPDFTAQTVGATSFTDSASRPWTISAPATIDNWQTRFVGEIGEIAPTWVDGDVDGGRRVDIAAAGTLRRLTQGAKALNSTLYRSTMSSEWVSNLKGYWPFEDGREAEQAASPLIGVNPARVLAVNFAGDDTLDASAALATASGGTPTLWLAPCPSFTASDWMGEIFIKVETVATSPSWTQLFAIRSTGTVKTWVYEVNNLDSRLRGLDLTGTAIFTTNLTGVTPAGGEWWNLSIQAAQNGGNVDYEFWQYSLDSGGTGNTGSTAGTLGRPTDIGYFDAAPADGFAFGHVAITTGLTAGWRSTAIPGASNAWITERAAARVQRLCLEEDVPVVIFGKFTDSARMGPQRPDTLVNLLQECADADGGILCEQRHASGLAYRTRSSLYNQDPVFDVTALSRGLINPFEPVLDDQRLRNDITVTRVGGSSARVVDDDSVAAEGTYSEAPPDFNVANDYQLDDIAGWELHKGTWPELRYPSVSIRHRDVLTSRALLDGYMQSGLGDIARVSDLPTHHPPGPVDQMIEQQTDDIGSFDWTAGIVGSPAGIWTVGVIQDSVLGRADTEGSELAGTESTTDTSWSVTTTSGPVWIDSATYGSMFPFEVEAAGEVVRVTAITGTSSPQTFTVVRSVNGVVKAHTAGTPIALADPWVAAL